MSTNQITVVLNVKDEASKVIKNLNLSVQQVTGSIQSLDSAGSSSFNRLKGSITGAIVQAELLRKTFDLVRASANGVWSQIKAGTDIQKQTLGTIGTYMSITGQNYQQATEFVRNFRKEMSLAAAALPGETADYTSIGQKLIPILSPLYMGPNGLNKAGLSSSLDSVTVNAGFLAQQFGDDADTVRKGISRFISGDSYKSLMTRNQFFADNQQVLDKAYTIAKSQGVNLNNRSTSQLTRFNILQEALGQSVPEEIKKRSQDTVDGLVQGFISNLFDPDSGIFGINRAVGKDGKTVFDSFGKAVKAFLGNDGLLNKLGLVLFRVGINADNIMSNIRNGFENLAKWADSVKSYVSQFTSASSDPDKKWNDPVKDVDFKAIAKKISDGIFNWVMGVADQFGNVKNTKGYQIANDAISGILQSLDNVDFNRLFSDIGAGSAAIVNLAAKGDLVGIVGKIIAGLFSGLGSFLSNLSPQAYATIFALFGISKTIGLAGAGIGLAKKTIGNKITESIASFGSDAIAEIFGNKVASTAAKTPLSAMLSGGAKEATKDSFGTILGRGLNSFFGKVSTMVAGAAKLPSAAIAALTAGANWFYIKVSGFVSGVGNAIKVAAVAGAEMAASALAFFGEVAGALALPVPLLIAAVVAAVGFLIYEIVQHREQIWGFIVNVFDHIKDFFSAVWDKIKAAAGWFSDLLMPQKPGEHHAEHKIQYSQPSSLRYGTAYTPNHAGGFIPVGSLLAAAAREAKNMPSDAELVLANSSEAILNRAQQAALARSVSGGGGGHVSFTVQQLIIQSDAQDPVATAKKVIAELERQVHEMKRSNLTALVV
jgi:hypothetical protein